jgi:hypothetical protein
MSVAEDLNSKFKKSIENETLDVTFHEIVNNECEIVKCNIEDSL